MARVYTCQIAVAESAIDANGHVNNIEFVRWMQEAAVSHSDAAGCTAATKQAGATWVVRSHHIQYLRPAFAGDRITVRTWVADFRRAFSLRKYEFVRENNGDAARFLLATSPFSSIPGSEVLARGETDWVFVDLATGRPRSIPNSITGLFEVVSTLDGDSERRQHGK